MVSDSFILTHMRYNKCTYVLASAPLAVSRPIIDLPFFRHNKEGVNLIISRLNKEITSLSHAVVNLILPVQ